MNQPRVFLAATLGAALFAGAFGLSGTTARAQAPITINPRTVPAQPAPQLAPGVLPAPGAIPAAPTHPGTPAAVAATAAAAAEETKAIAALAAEIVGQQAIMAENQKVIDTKLAVIAENIRIARIYASRGGGPK